MNNMYVYIEGFAGNGFEDSGVQIFETKLFVNKDDAIKYSLNRLREVAKDYIEDFKFENVEEEFNGFIDEEGGNWELNPESTLFGVVELSK